VKVTFVLPMPHCSGGMRTIAFYAGCLRDRAHEVTLVAVPPPEPSLKERVRTLVLSRVWLQVASQVNYTYFDQQKLHC